MDNNEINNVFVKLQDLYFKKAGEDQINEFLGSKQLSIDSLIQKFEKLELKDDYMLENVFRIIEMLISYPSYKTHLYNAIITKQEIIIQSKIPKIAKFILNFIRNNLSFFTKDQGFLNSILIVYLFDENAGIYEQARELMIYILNSDKFDDNFINNSAIFHKFANNNKDSILLVRSIEIVIFLMTTNEKHQNDSQKC
jgi:hypothetical protein